MYSQAIAGAATDHTLFANRSAAYLAQCLSHEALLDAQKAVQLAPTWAKAHYRHANIHTVLSVQQQHLLYCQGYRQLLGSSRTLLRILVQGGLCTVSHGALARGGGSL